MFWCIIIQIPYAINRCFLIDKMNASLIFIIQEPRLSISQNFKIIDLICYHTKSVSKISLLLQTILYNHLVLKLIFHYPGSGCLLISIEDDSFVGVLIVFEYLMSLAVLFFDCSSFGC